MHGVVFSVCRNDSIDEDWEQEIDFYMKNFCTVEIVNHYIFGDVRQCCPNMAHYNHNDPDNPIVPNQLKMNLD